MVATRYGLFPAKTTKRVIKARFGWTSIRMYLHTEHLECRCTYFSA